MKRFNPLPMAGALVAVVLAGALSTMAQQALPDTIWVRVIFYDYKADGSNPNFEPTGYSDPSNGDTGLRYNMVLTTLGPDLKPVWSGINSRYNERLNEWFRPASETNASTQFVYNSTTGDYEWSNLVNYSGRSDEWVIQGFDANYDMATIVMYDSLGFSLYDSATGAYQFDSDAFFPIDGRGWGAQPADYSAYNWTNDEGRNYSFAMELHVQFTYRPGLHFDFVGDDDVWAYINGDLVINLGGIHGEQPQAVDLDTLGLTEGQRYWLHFFYCERHVTGSHIQITTNLVAPLEIDSLALVAVPADAEIVAGDSVRYEATVFVDSVDEFGNHSLIPRPDYGPLVNWSVSGDANNPPLSSDRGSSTTFYGERAYNTYTVTASVRDPVTGEIFAEQLQVTVVPGPPEQLVIEADNSPDNWTPNPANRITLSVGVTYDSVYAVLRDRFDNLVGFAESASWGSFNTDVVHVNATPGRAYEGVVSRGSFAIAQTDSTRIEASQGGLTDDALVVIMNILKVAPPVATPGDTIFVGSIDIALATATDGATIYYCTNGCGNPQAEGSEYTGTFSLTQPDTTVVRAIAVKDGWEQSDISTFTYINERDTEGPWVTEVVFYLGNPPGGNNPDAQDTLVISFNEPVRIDELRNLTNAFVYTDNGTSGQENAVLGPGALVEPANGDSFVTEIVVVFDGGSDHVTPEIDEITFRPGAVVDGWNNVAPTDPEDVVVDWGRTYDMVIAVSSNPFRPGRQTVDLTPLNLSPADLAVQGEPPVAATALRVSSVKAMDAGRSSMAIYDALGNLVEDDMPMYSSVPQGNEHQAYFFWDAHNRNGRLVGAGTYLAVMEVAEQDGNTQLNRQKIGVMR